MPLVQVILRVPLLLVMLGKVVWPVVLPLGPPRKYSMPSGTPSLS